MSATLTKTPISPQDLGAELVDTIVKAKSVDDWKKKALAHVRKKMLQVVGGGAGGSATILRANHAPRLTGFASRPSDSPARMPAAESTPPRCGRS